MKFQNPFAIKKAQGGAGNSASSVALGDAARDDKEWGRAADFYGLHVHENPYDFGIWVQYGHALKEAGRLNEASVAYERADSLSPHDADLTLNRGHLAKLRGDFQQADRLYRETIKLNSSSEALRELALIRVQVASTSKAEPKETLVSELGTEVEIELESISTGSVDSCEGGIISGWIVNQGENQPILEVVVNDTVVARGRPTFPRPDVEAAGFGGGLTGFRISAAKRFRIGDTVSVRVEGEGRPFGSKTARPSKNLRTWIERNDRLSREEFSALKLTSNRETENQTLSIILPAQNVSEVRLREALDSLLDQWSDRWEVICVEDVTLDPKVRDAISEFAHVDERIRTICLDTSPSHATAVNVALAQATGQYVVVMDANNVYEPEAVYRILDSAKTNPGLIYSDAAFTSEDVNDVEQFSLRPAFSHEYFLNFPYIDHLVCADADIARELGGFDENLESATQVDFILRLIEKTNDVVHVPAVLVRVRKSSDDEDTAPQASVQEAMIAAINRHLSRIGSQGVAKASVSEDTIRVDYPDNRGRTLIIIPTKDRVDLLKTCLESLWLTVNSDEVDIVVIDHESRAAESLRYFKKVSKKVKIYPYKGAFNFGRMNNHAFKDLWNGQEYVLFLNNDIEAFQPGWLERLRMQAARPEVGVVGANLLYGDGRVQHNGVLIGLNGAADHGHKLAEFEVGGTRLGGYDNSLIATRDYSAVTAACMLMRSEVFHGVGGYDEALEIGFNDTDLCLRVGALGYSIINEAHAVLYHHESATRANTATLDHPDDNRRFMRRWSRLISVGDPFYNPLLSSQVDYAEGDIAQMYHPPRHRKVRPGIRPLKEGIPRQVPSQISLNS